MEENVLFNCKDVDRDAVPRFLRMDVIYVGSVLKVLSICMLYKGAIDGTCAAEIQW